MKVISVVGARPNFMKMAPVHKAFKKYNEEHPGADVQHLICHTGQHYDEKMSKVFFEDLELPKPDFYLGVGSGSHAEQTGRVMIEFEKILIAEKPDLIIVYGDVNSTAACAITAAKLHIKVAHVEAGLRSFDRTMPEEINRMLTDVIADYLFVTEPSGIVNLTNEGIPANKVFFVGNTMIDSLIYYLPRAEQLTDPGRQTDPSRQLAVSSTQEEERNTSTQYAIRNRQENTSKQEEKKLPTANRQPDSMKNISSGKLPTGQTGDKPYILITMHRPSNVDDKNFSAQFIGMLTNLAKNATIVFPVHPRTRKNFDEWGILKGLPQNIKLTEPVPYIEFISLIKNAALVITDSGGIQEETTYLGVPCITLRENTERPVTVELGTNLLVGTDLKIVYTEATKILNGEVKKGSVPELWDGKAAERIVDIITSRQ
jgi:UDP-N-acetylglucosamine 2-epimerase (non-hydrolysing)